MGQALANLKDEEAGKDESEELEEAGAPAAPNLGCWWRSRRISRTRQSPI